MIARGRHLDQVADAVIEAALNPEISQPAQTMKVFGKRVVLRYTSHLC
jgi:hypothetical protein